MSQPKKNYDPPWRTRLNQRGDPDVDVPDGEIRRGYELYTRSCAGCHALDEPGWLGPSMRDVFGRKIGSQKGFFYSTAMSLTKGNWTKEKLYAFLENPEEVIPNTAMFFDGIQDTRDRACVIEYLQFLKTTVKPKEKSKVQPQPLQATQTQTKEGEQAN